MGISTFVTYLLDAGIPHCAIAGLLPVYLQMSSVGPVAVEVSACKSA